jgi:hypothetical protein
VQPLLAVNRVPVAILEVEALDPALVQLPALVQDLEGRWTPTYIKSDAEGWWCDPYWGCYVVGDAQYSNQFELSGGIVLRF